MIKMARKKGLFVGKKVKIPSWMGGKMGTIEKLWAPKFSTRETQALVKGPKYESLMWFKEE
tara:strand:+ start:5178 stop:5360 length:183 start_codon:yes stop_codon:yes gene_type:complete